MRRGIIILALGMTGASVAYCCFYLMGTATPRALMRSAKPELAWLQHEFNIGDAEFQRISQLHNDYVSQCKERCRRIEAVNTRLSNALVTATQMTPDLERMLTERAQMRAACQTEMLKHLFEVSRKMPPEQGRRYLAWARDNTCLREQAMDHGNNSHEATTPSARQP